MVIGNAFSVKRDIFTDETVAKGENKMENIGALLKSFMEKEFPKIEENIYNEFSLQHEIGIFLREKLTPKGYKVQFERNIYDILKIGKTPSSIENETFEKSEMDIYIYINDEQYAIELKYPTNGQTPNQMYNFCKDIRFMELVKKNARFQQTYVLTLVNDNKQGKSFYNGKGKNPKSQKIYNLFCRQNVDGKKNICIESGIIEYPLSDGKGHDFFILGDYKTEWKTVKSYPQYHYYILSIGE